MEITVTGRDGALTKFRIVGAAKHFDIIPSIGYITRVDGDDVIGSGSKRDLATLQSWVKSTNAASATAPTANKAERYITLLSIAERDGLSHGKSWYADGFCADRHNLPPEYEGELVCYVYPQ